MDDVLLRYRGRSITAADAAEIQSLIDEHPAANRRRLSILLCEQWNWRQANGELRHGVCRSLLIALHRAGHIRLPAPLHKQPTRGRHNRPAPVSIDRSPLEGTLRELGSLSIRQVRRTADEALFDGLIEEHHYLGYTRPIGEHLKHLVTTDDGRPIACFAWSSAPRHLRLRDRFIGWPADTRRRNIHLLAYNTRFLILPWVKVEHLASHLLGRLARRISSDWIAHYAHPIYYLETFVDPARFRGTCYRAANWIVLGRTSGRGNNAPTKEQRVPIKDVLGYPLGRDFRARLSEVGQ